MIVAGSRGSPGVHKLRVLTSPSFVFEDDSCCKASVRTHVQSPQSTEMSTYVCV